MCSQKLRLMLMILLRSMKYRSTSHKTTLFAQTTGMNPLIEPNSSKQREIVRDYSISEIVVCSLTLYWSVGHSRGIIQMEQWLCVGAYALQVEFERLPYLATQLILYKFFWNNIKNFVRKKRAPNTNMNLMCGWSDQQVGNSTRKINKCSVDLDHFALVSRISSWNCSSSLSSLSLLSSQLLDRWYAFGICKL